MVFVLKTGKSAKDPFNYRPISLLNIIGKLLERIIGQRYLYFLEHHNILDEFQLGFRPNRSTQQAIEIIASKLQYNCDNRYSSMIVSSDVHKAFDTVWWRGLLHKIYHLTEDQFAITALIYNYLDRRAIEPVFNGITADVFHPKSGVPQGSSLGPILYIVFVNDIPPPLYHDTVISRFADDIGYVITSDTKTDTNATKRAQRLIIKTKNELKNTAKWFNNWKIKINPSKTEIGIRGITKRSIDNAGGVSINNNRINVSNTIKILGYMFDNNKYSHSQVANKAVSAYNQVNKLYKFNQAPPKIQIYLYKMLVRPLLEYAPIRITSSTRADIEKLQKIQNRALRNIYHIQWWQLITNKELHQRSKLITIKERLDKLSKKSISKFQNNFLRDSLPVPIYKYSDYEINDPPILEPKRVIRQIFNEYNRYLPLE